jgi:MerR family transcriptional regulator, copper efflux regulator
VGRFERELELSTCPPPRAALEVRGRCAESDLLTIAQPADEHMVNAKQAMLLPMIDKGSLLDAQTLIAADAGYYSDENVVALHDAGIPALVADNRMRQRDECIDNEHHKTEGEVLCNKRSQTRPITVYLWTTRVLADRRTRALSTTKPYGQPCTAGRSAGCHSSESCRPSDSAKLAKLVRMRISELALRTGVSAYRLRHYEELGLIHAERSGSGYRRFADRTVREVTFIAMSRDLGFSLKDIGEALPRYRAGTLTVEEMVEIMRGRIAEVDAQIAIQRALRKKLVAHIAWLKKRKREFAHRGSEKTPSPWATKRKSTQ